MAEYFFVYETPSGTRTETRDFSTETEAINHARNAGRSTQVDIYRDKQLVTTVRHR